MKRPKADCVQTVHSCILPLRSFAVAYKAVFAQVFIKFYLAIKLG